MMGEAGEIWAKGASLGECMGEVEVDGVQVISNLYYLVCDADAQLGRTNVYAGVECAYCGAGVRGQDEPREGKDVSVR